jgi:hypothetical protein
VPPRTSNDQGPLRQAPATDPIPASSPPGGGRNGSQGDRGRSRITWVIAAMATLAVAGGVAWFVTTQGGGVSPSPPGVSPVPPRVPFAFATFKLHVSSYSGKTSREAAETVAEKVRAELSTLYDRAYVDPATWANGFPPEMWELFAPGAAARAQQDAESFGLAGVEGMEGLEIIEATLTVDVLEDPGRRPLSALATVRFRSTGTRSDGSTLEVRSKAAYLFRPVNGRWLIVGFPSFETKLDSVPPPAPAAGPSSGPTPSSNQTGGAG